MTAVDRQDRNETQEQQRATKDEARNQGVGTPEVGTELPARSSTDDSGVADLGVEEPVVIERVKDDPAERQRRSGTAWKERKIREEMERDANR